MTNSISAKIAKIIAKADSTTNDTEAEIFMAKAHQLMQEHGLSLLDLGRLDKDDPIGHDEAVYTSSDPWKDKVANQLAKYYGCSMVRVPGGKTTWQYTVFGRESARVTFSLMLPYVIKQVARMALAEYKSGQYPSANKARTAIANALAIRLHRLQKKNKDALKTERGESGLNALVPVDLIEQAIEEEYGGTLRKSRASYNTDSRAVSKAEGISLYRQTGAAAGAKRIAG